MSGNELLILIPDTKVFQLIKTIYYQNSGVIDYKNQKGTSKDEGWQSTKVGEKKPRNRSEMGFESRTSREHNKETIENIFIALIYT